MWNSVLFFIKSQTLFLWHWTPQVCLFLWCFFIHNDFFFSSNFTAMRAADQKMYYHGGVTWSHPSMLLSTLSQSGKTILYLWLGLQAVISCLMPRAGWQNLWLSMACLQCALPSSNRLLIFYLLIKCAVWHIITSLHCTSCLSMKSHGLRFQSWPTFRIGQLSGLISVPMVAEKMTMVAIQSANLQLFSTLNVEKKMKDSFLWKL